MRSSPEYGDFRTSRHYRYLLIISDSIDRNFSFLFAVRRVYCDFNSSRYVSDTLNRVAFIRCFLTDVCCCQWSVTFSYERSVFIRTFLKSYKKPTSIEPHWCAREQPFFFSRRSHLTAPCSPVVQRSPRSPC